MLLYNLFVLSSVLLSSGHAITFDTDLGLTHYNLENKDKEDGLRDSFKKYFDEHCRRFNLTTSLRYDRKMYHYLYEYFYYWWKPYHIARIFYSFIDSTIRTSKNWSTIGEEHVKYITSYHRSGNTKETCEMLSKHPKFVCQAYTYVWSGIWLYCAFVVPNGK
ncbi:unnamed protein product [Cylicocyclus nassatus]|uniref:Uncharacterized protein n=1 Tax=Cylicocyclus nassatus TaxID=53992 RepID=A0AA36M3W2_CYLNA|nr:unnamed protein product [Cylicocyclus nassatus]